jgi:phenylacetate-CoA ligase
MVVLQPRTLPATAWPAVPPGANSQLWAMYLELERTQWLDRAALEQAQLAQVRALLSHSVAHVPFYQRLLQAAGIVPADIRTMADFRRIPILQRRVYQEQLDQLTARSLPSGMTQTARQRTSGSSGMPIDVLQTNLVNLWWFAFCLRDFQWCDMDPRGTLAVIRSLGGPEKERQRRLEGVGMPYWGDQIHSVVENGPAFAMDIHQEPRKQMEWLVRVQPTYLTSYPPNLDFLASLLRETGQRIASLGVIQAIGETLTAETRTRIEDGFGVPVRSSYSCVEAGYVGSPCPAGHGLHVHAENVVLEVLDDVGEPCPPGATGRVVLTTLHNYLTPFLRYEILDRATVGPELCPCGRGLPLLTAIEGKRRPQFRLPDGRRKDSGYLVRNLRQLGGYHQHQIVQRAADHIIVRLVPDQSWTPEHIPRIVQWVQDYFETPMRVDVLTVPSIELSASGKLREIINELEPGDKIA